jgi:hypothetical protein
MSPDVSGRPGRFDIVDAFTVVGPWRDRPPGAAYEFEDLLEEHHRFGIGRRLTLHAEARDGVPDEGNLAVDRMTFLRDDTAPIWTVLPNRRFGAPTVEKTMSEAERAGVGMFAFFPETHGHHIAPWANRELYAAMEYVRLPLVLDVGNAQGAEARRHYEQIHSVAVAHPGLPIVIWNAFYMDERLLVPLLDLCRNVHLGLATVFIPTFGMEQFTARYGGGRLLFGSNWPRQSPGPLLTYILYADVSDRVKIEILSANVERLLRNVRWSVRGFKKPAPVAAGAEGAPAEEPSAPTEPPPSDAGEEPGSDEPPAPWLQALADLKSGVLEDEE